jgi:hypothetical protein
MTPVTTCCNCSSKNLKFIEGFEYNDIMDSKKPLKSDVFLCGECGCFHFEQDGKQGFRFSIHVGNNETKKINYISDYERAVQEKQKELCVN